MTPKLLSSVVAALQGPAMQKFVAKLTSRAVVAPVVYSLLCMTVFALVYGLIGFKNLFQTDDNNKDKNWENSINASVMLQSNAMGTVTPINSLGTWLYTAQVLVGWMWFMVITALLL